MPASLVWFRLDLRLSDNPALAAALERGGAVIPVYIWDPRGEQPWPPGAASRWWLHHSLKALARDLSSRGSRLIYRTGSSLQELQKLIHETGADAVYWNDRYEPAVVARDRKAAQNLSCEGVLVQNFNSNLLWDPWFIKNKSMRPFQVFTPFWAKCLGLPVPSMPTRAPMKIPGPGSWPKTEKLESFNLLPCVNWTRGLEPSWRPGEKNALDLLTQFEENVLSGYDVSRDLPGSTGTSRLSPHLHFGEIGPRQIWHQLHRRTARHRQAGLIRGMEVCLKELGWREFAHHLLVHFPKTPEEPLHAEFERFPWRRDPKRLRLWQKGRTGYPLVDAGMRQLWSTGWMHNRARMIVGSFLVKDLLVSWRDGAAWFWDTLVDADLANNTLGWQWVAGCGADAAPFFRIFNPVTQGRRFDPEGSYVRHWIPELAPLPNRWIHEPWKAPSFCRISSYAPPCVDHSGARIQALAAYDRLRQRNF